MKKQGKALLCMGILLLALFVVWTVMVQVVDVQPTGETGAKIGFAALNSWFHRLTGVHLWGYTVTDWLGLIPIFVCLAFGAVGFGQLVKRKRLLAVDSDILLLGVYYLIVVVCYFAFEMVPVNYRPILIEGRMEASYPSSTTLLVLSVMPTLALQVSRRSRNVKIKRGLAALTVIFSVAMVIGRLLSGVHWVTDIVGSVLLSGGLFCVYWAAVLLCDKMVDGRGCDGAA